MCSYHDLIQAVIRSVCAIIDSFHFKVDLDDDPTAAAAPPQLPEEVPGGEAVEGALEGVREGKEKPEAATGREILGALTKRVLPVLQSVLVSRSVTLAGRMMFGRLTVFQVLFSRCK